MLGVGHLEKEGPGLDGEAREHVERIAAQRERDDAHGPRIVGGSPGCVKRCRFPCTLASRRASV